MLSQVMKLANDSTAVIGQKWENDKLWEIERAQVAAQWYQENCQVVVTHNVANINPPYGNTLYMNTCQIRTFED